MAGLRGLVLIVTLRIHSRFPIEATVNGDHRQCRLEWVHVLEIREALPQE